MDKSGRAMIRTLRRVALFSDCTEDELRDVATLLDRISVPKGTRLLRQDDASRQFFVILSGYARITRDGVSLGTVGPGSFVGEMALLSGKLPSATVTSLTTMEVCTLGAAGFQMLLDRVPPLGERVQRTAVDRAAAQHVIRGRPEQSDP